MVALPLATKDSYIKKRKPTTIQRIWFKFYKLNRLKLPQYQCKASLGWDGNSEDKILTKKQINLTI